MDNTCASLYLTYSFAVLSFISVVIFLVRKFTFLLLLLLCMSCLCVFVFVSVISSGWSAFTCLVTSASSKRRFLTLTKSYLLLVLGKRKRVCSLARRLNVSVTFQRSAPWTVLQRLTRLCGTYCVERAVSHGEKLLFVCVHKSFS